MFDSECPSLLTRLFPKSDHFESDKCSYSALPDYYRDYDDNDCPTYVSSPRFDVAHDSRSLVIVRFDERHLLQFGGGLIVP